MKNDQYVFCALITYPWMAEHLFKWNDQYSKEQKNDVREQCIKYLTNTFIKRIESSKTQTEFDSTLTKGINSIKRKYAPYHKNHDFVLYAKWVNSFLKLAYMQKLLNIRESFLHCPIDRIVLSEIGMANQSWSKKNEQEYNDIIKQIRKSKPKDQTIFCWELKFWNKKKRGI